MRQVQGGVTIPDIHTMGTNPDIHRTYDNLANYDSGDNLETYRHRAYSTEELNAVYNISGDKEGQQHILQGYNPGYLYDQQLPPHVPLHQHLPPHLPLHQLDTHQLSHPEDSAEPIYQNQGQILAQQQEREGEEPIYQNLPLHEKLNLPIAESDHSDTGSIHIDDTVDGVPLG